MADKIKGDYDSHTKDELLAEAQARGISSVTTASLKADIVAALELDDEDKAKPPTKPEADEQPSGASGLPKVEEQPLPAPEIYTAPDDGEYKGRYVKVAGVDTGEVFALAVKESPDPLKRFYHAKNTIHYWNGTRAEFREQFEKQ